MCMYKLARLKNLQIANRYHKKIFVEKIKRMWEIWVRWRICRQFCALGPIIFFARMKFRDNFFSLKRKMDKLKKYKFK